MWAFAERQKLTLDSLNAHALKIEICPLVLPNELGDSAGRSFSSA